MRLFNTHTKAFHMTPATTPGKDYSKQLKSNNMSDNRERVYVPATFGNLVTFNDGGWVANIDFTDLKAFSDFVKKFKQEDGRLRLSITQQRNNPEKLSIYLNTYAGKKEEVPAEEADIS